VGGGWDPSLLCPLDPCEGNWARASETLSFDNRLKASAGSVIHSLTPQMGLRRDGVHGSGGPGRLP
jgi:hypothetical protein